MGDLSTEMIVPRANEYHFGFAFNDLDFSDRILHLEIIPEYESIDSSKNLRGDKYHGWFSSISADQCNDWKPYDGAKVVTLHINSVILAAKSPFFYKLFKNGMRESQHKNHVSLRISASEETTLMDLLNFMYGNKLRATSVTDLVDLLIAADKFGVACCMSCCIEMLLKLPLSLEYALLYLELPSSVIVSKIVQPLIDEANKYVVAHFKDFTKFQEEAMELSLSALEVVLGSEGIEVISEDNVFDFILDWARAHYPELHERREILTERLVRLICFPNMSGSKLKEVLVCRDFDHEQVLKLVMEALFSKVEHSCGQHIHASKELATTNCCFLRRLYKPRCVVYFDIKKDDLKSLSPLNYINSQTFCLGGKQLLLSAGCGQNHDHFTLHVLKANNTETCTLDFELAVMKKSSKEFKSRLKVNNHNLGDSGWGSRNLLSMSWTDFICDDSDYFIDDILHLRAKITLVNNP